MMVEVLPLTDRSVLVRGFPKSESPSVGEHLCTLGFDARNGLEDILVVVDEPSASLGGEVEKALLSLSQEKSMVRQFSFPGTEVTVPIVYDGVDLDAVAESLGVSSREVVEMHQSLSWTVAMVGFAPGFPYLVPDRETPLVKVPRLATPRERVPEGAVGVAAGMSCIYPSAMPGGWNLIGSTELALFDPERKAPSLLSVGDTVIFREVS